MNKESCGDEHLDGSCPCRVIGPGTYPPDDPDGSKSRKKFAEMLRDAPFSEKSVEKARSESRRELDKLLGRHPISDASTGSNPCQEVVVGVSQTCGPQSIAKKDSYVGLDLSLTGTGFCLKRGDVFTIETVSTKPKDFKTDLDRLAHIRDTLLRKIPADVKMICIEDFYVPANPMQLGSAIKLAMLGTVIRMTLHEKGIPFVIIAPSQLKKFVTGKGTGEKSMILREVFKRWGINAEDDNQADASVLAYLAEALVAPLTDDVPKFQVEVVKTVRKERPRYNVKEAWATEAVKEE